MQSLHETIIGKAGLPMRTLLLIIVASISYSAETFVEKPASIAGLYSFLGLAQYNIEYQSDTGFKKITASLKEYSRGPDGVLALKKIISTQTAGTLTTNHTFPLSIIYGDGNLAFNIGESFGKYTVDKTVFDKYKMRFTSPTKIGGYQVLWNRTKNDNVSSDNIDDLVDFIAIEVTSE
jgi:hypothetical protein